MPNLICRGLSFSYDGSEANVFSDLDLIIDTRWRTALAGANGRGKTTLLRLLAGELEPDRGEIERPVSCRLFSDRAADDSLSAWESAKDMAGPFRRWEREIDALLSAGDEASLARYGELESRFRARGGYAIEAALEAELTALGLDRGLWSRPLTSLSGGEQTRCLLAGLFAARAGFPLVDEPTNHLDLAGRKLVAGYLAGKPGFLLVSHDRAFLDDCVDHVIALNPQTVDTARGSYTAWRESHRRQLAGQVRSNALLKKDIRRLEATAAARRTGADAKEAEKTAAGRSTLPSGRGKDKGFIGARAARQMKRALAAERRAGQAADERRGSLVDVEKTYALKVLAPDSAKLLREPLVRAREVSLVRGSRLFEPVSFEIGSGDRVALIGPNGCGKTSLLDVLAALAGPDQEPAIDLGPDAGLSVDGALAVASRLQISRASQIPRWRTGRLRAHLDDAGLDEASLRQIMAALGVRGGVLDQPLEQLSQGQLKKIELARSLATPAHLYLWDEPLNYVDVDARERLENAMLDSGASFLFAEHDALFVARLATKTVSLAAVRRASTDAGEKP